MFDVVLYFPVQLNSMSCSSVNSTVVRFIVLVVFVTWLPKRRGVKVIKSQNHRKLIQNMAVHYTVNLVGSSYRRYKCGLFDIAFCLKELQHYTKIVLYKTF